MDGDGRLGMDVAVVVVRYWGGTLGDVTAAAAAAVVVLRCWGRLVWGWTSWWWCCVVWRAWPAGGCRGCGGVVSDTPVLTSPVRACPPVR